MYKKGRCFTSVAVLLMLVISQVLCGVGVTMKDDVVMLSVEFAQTIAATLSQL